MLSVCGVAQLDSECEAIRGGDHLTSGYAQPQGGCWGRAAVRAAQQRTCHVSPREVE